MQKLLLLQFTMLLFVTTYAQKEIKLSDARKHVGDSVTVTGWITGARFLSHVNNPTLFLEMNAEKPNEKMILIVMNKDDSHAFVVKNKALNKAVRVRGKVRLLRGQPMIVVHNEKQITTLHKETASPKIYKN